jgi:2-haloacid dehalogenase
MAMAKGECRVADRTIKGAVFDLGGVVIDWNPRYVYRDVFAGDEAKMEYFLSTVCPMSWNAQTDAGQSIAEAITERVALFPAWEKEIRVYYARWIEMIRDPIPGTTEIVAGLKAKGIRVWALSNWSAETFPLVRDRVPAFGLFEKIFLSGEYRMIKPDPRFFRAALDEIGIPAENLTFIDDNLANVAAAKALGFAALAFTDASRLKADLASLGLADI